MSRTGVWLVGARGSVATLTMVGARAITAGHASKTGMVTARPPVSALDLPAVDDLVFAGHEVRSGSLARRAAELEARNGVPDRDVLQVVREDLDTIDDRIVTGTAVNSAPAVAELADEERQDDRPVSDIVEQIRADYSAFEDRLGLDRVVVMNVASTEPPIQNPSEYDTLDAFEAALEADDHDLPASSLYAYSALVDSRPYVNFTPSTGSALGGLQELASKNGVPHMGRDAKTGETLVKSALAPMFAGRNLRVRAWEGHNILGNLDGRVLEDEASEAGKVQTKGDVLEHLLPDIDHHRVRIDYTPSLGDWKTAWDYIDFEGFLNTRMKLQFTWEGSDSALAAPLVLDLVRLIAHADAHDEGGLQPHLASFFKAPLGVDEHDLSRQFDMLDDYVRTHTDAVPAQRGVDG